jgi:hypothetical protein
MPEPAKRRQAAAVMGPTICWQCAHYKPQRIGMLPGFGLCLKWSQSSFGEGGCWWGTAKDPPKPARKARKAKTA